MFRLSNNILSTNFDVNSVHKHDEKENKNEVNPRCKLQAILDWGHGTP